MKCVKPKMANIRTKAKNIAKKGAALALAGSLLFSGLAAENKSVVIPDSLRKNIEKKYDLEQNKGEVIKFEKFKLNIVNKENIIGFLKNENCMVVIDSKYCTYCKHSEKAITNWLLAMSKSSYNLKEAKYLETVAFGKIDFADFNVYNRISGDLSKGTPLQLPVILYYHKGKLVYFTSGFKDKNTHIKDITKNISTIFFK